MRPHSPSVPRRSALFAVACCPLLTGCNELQSVLAPHSLEAEQTAVLSWLLFIGGTLIFLFVMALAAFAIFGGDQLRSWLARPGSIFSGGVIFPLVTLTALLAYGLTLLRSQPLDGSEPLRVHVEGEQWWWRVTYPQSAGYDVESANEIRVPVGRPVRLHLTTADVIHSFWVPQLAGKMDMIPGRTNVLQFQATAQGSFRGQCAEYCGGAHALMGLRVIALEPDAFAAWLEQERKPAPEPSEGIAARGMQLFLQRGCPACHAVAGTKAVGTIGPNLSHVGSRQAIAAERLPMSQQNLVRWIRHAKELKPSTQMPSFAELPGEETDAIASYLMSLK